MVIAFTGHRPQRMARELFNNQLKSKLVSLLEEKKPKGAIVGMAVGFDSYVADVLYDMSIRYVAAIPFAAHMRTPNKEYHRILNNAYKYVIVSTGPYSPSFYIIRDEFMVNKSDMLVSGFDGIKSGGTWATIRYAIDNGKPIEHLWKGV